MAIWYDYALLQAHALITRMLLVKNLNFSYDEHQLFTDLNLHIAEGKLTCLLGASGCGKSTLLKIISGIIPIPHFQRHVFINHHQPLADQIAYMGQSDLLLPWLSCLNNVLLGYKLRKAPISAKLKTQALQILKKLGLEKFINYYPAQLSGGMRQRVAIARTLLENKSIILMDEPFSSIDAINRQQLQNLAIHELHDKTILLVTHDPLEAIRMADHIYVFTADGQLKEFDLTTPAPREMNQAALFELYQQLLSFLQTDEKAA